MLVQIEQVSNLVLAQQINYQFKTIHRQVKLSFQMFCNKLHRKIKHLKTLSLRSHRLVQDYRELINKSFNSNNCKRIHN